MQLIVTGRHVEVTPAMKQYARDKLSRIMRERPRINEVHVIMDVEKYRHRVELTARGKNLELFCHEETPDMYASIDGALAKLERQLRRYRERHARRHQPPPELARDAVPGEEPFERGEPYIAQRFAMKPMYLNEALLRMKVEPHFFLAFLNAKTEEVNLLYRTDDGELAHLAPKRFRFSNAEGRFKMSVYSEASIKPDSKPRPLRRDRHRVEWATPEEALSSMLAGRKKYRFFLNKSSRSACVVYQHAGGGYALIEPKE